MSLRASFAKPRRIEAGLRLKNRLAMTPGVLDRVNPIPYDLDSLVNHVSVRVFRPLAVEKAE